MAITTEPLTNSPLSPPPPGEIYFNEREQAWILSRHRHVHAALRSADLSQTGPPGTNAGSGAKPTPEKLQPEVFNALLNVSKWQREISGSALTLLQTFSGRQTVDLFAQYIRPWCLASAIALTGLNPLDSQSLTDLVSDLFASDAAPQDATLKCRANEANRALDGFFSRPRSRYAKSMFLGVAQTVPAFLASAWAALLQFPSEWKTLNAHPDCVPAATEELLRYAGPVHSLFRQADRDTTICGTRIPAGDRLILRLASANRDPLRFARPEILDIKRGAAGHLALSSGSHYCLGASATRAMTTTGTQAVTSRYPELALFAPVVWSCGTMLIWPTSLPVALGRTV
jgi:Cytochrome P450